MRVREAVRTAWEGLGVAVDRMFNIDPGPDPDAGHWNYMMDRGYTATGVAMGDPESRYLQSAWDRYYSAAEPVDQHEGDLFAQWDTERPSPDIVEAMESVMGDRPGALPDREHEDTLRVFGAMAEAVERAYQAEQQAEMAHLYGPDGQYSPAVQQAEIDSEAACDAEDRGWMDHEPGQAATGYSESELAQNYLEDVERHGREYADDQYAGVGIPFKYADQARDVAHPDEPVPYELTPEGEAQAEGDDINLHWFQPLPGEPGYQEAPAEAEWFEGQQSPASAELDAVNEEARQRVERDANGPDPEGYGENVPEPTTAEIDRYLHERMTAEVGMHADAIFTEVALKPGYWTKVATRSPGELRAMAGADPGIRVQEHNAELQRWGTDPKDPEPAMTPAEERQYESAQAEEFRGAEAEAQAQTAELEGAG